MDVDLTDYPEDSESDPKADPAGEEPKEDPKEEPASGEPVSSESMSAEERTNLIVIAVSVAFAVFVLFCIAVCWYLGRCCCEGCQKPTDN